MRTAPTTPSQKGGRPKRKSPRNITLDRKLAEKFKKIAFDEGISFSSYIERLMREKLETLTAKQP
jgi:hypothetical protein